MSMFGQASGDWTESSSALRVMYVSVKNSTGALVDAAFTQTNPPVVTAAATVSQSPGLQGRLGKSGVLGGSVAFTRPDVGSEAIGGPVEGLAAGLQAFVRPLGCFLNDARGNAYENLPAQASGRGPYVSAQGTFGNQLFETQVLDSAVVNFTAGDAITYIVGMELVASRNGYLMPRRLVDGGGAVQSNDLAQTAAEVASGASASTTLGIVTMTPDSSRNELVYDQRV